MATTKRTRTRTRRWSKDTSGKTQVSDWNVGEWSPSTTSGGAVGGSRVAGGGTPTPQQQREQEAVDRSRAGEFTGQVEQVAGEGAGTTRFFVKGRETRRIVAQQREQRTPMTMENLQAIAEQRAVDRSRAGEFTGRIEQFQDGKPQDVSERFFIRGKEAGRIETDETGKRVAVVTTHSRLDFPEQERGGVASIFLGSEGAEILEIEPSLPSLFPEPKQIDLSPPPTTTAKVFDFLVGETGQQAVRIGGLSVGGLTLAGVPLVDPTQIIPSVPVVDVKRAIMEHSEDISRIINIQPIDKIISTQIFGETKLSKTKRDFSIKRTAFGVRVGAELIPITPLGVGLVALAPATKFLPPISRLAVSTIIAVTGTAGALDPKLSPEQRVASGLIGGLGFAGAGFEITPYLRGGKARISPDFFRVKTAEKGFEIIETPKIDIGLIPEKFPIRTGGTADVQLPSTSPLVRGGFGRRPGGESIFLGEQQFLATSQRGLFVPGETLKLADPFFVTPQEPFIKIAETRISRLALGEGLFSYPKDATIGFGVPPKSQIGITIGDVGRVETAKVWKLGTGTELEAIKTYGTIQDVQKIGATAIKGEGVDIFTFKIGKDLEGAGKSFDAFQSSTTGTSIATGETILGTGGLRTRGDSTITSPPITIPTTTLTLSSTTTIPTIKTTPTTFPISSRTGTISPPTIPTTIPTTLIIPPSIPPTYKTPISIPPSLPPTIRSPPISPPIIIKTPPSKAPFFFGGIEKKTPLQKFLVSERRFGKFQPVGFTGDIGKAIHLGSQRVSRTLGATFKIEQVKGKKIGLPREIRGFRTKITPSGFEFIEPRRKRLSKASEVEEIQFFKQKKGKGKGLFDFKF